jgi:hypothetical protein
MELMSVRPKMPFFHLHRRDSKQGDQMSWWKNAQNVTKTVFIEINTPPRKNRCTVIRITSVIKKITTQSTPWA